MEPSINQNKTIPVFMILLKVEKLLTEQLQQFLLIKYCMVNQFLSSGLYLSPVSELIRKHIAK